MKKKVSVCVIGSFLFLAMVIPQVQASTFLGETTWTITISENSGNNNPIGATFTLTGGISKVGGNYYLFQGYLSIPDELPSVLSGAGVLSNDNLILTASSSRNDSEIAKSDTGVIRIVLNKTTLNGTFYEVRTVLDNETNPKTISHGYTIGSINCTGQVLPLQ